MSNSTNGSGKTAWVAGATGLVGSHLMAQLCAHPAYDKVIALVRKPSQAQWTEYTKAEQWVVSYDHLKAPEPGIAVNDLFCALGTTKKKTPNPKQFHLIDTIYPQRFAELGLHHGARYYGVVSAHGASAHSPFRYFRMKGEMEAGLEKLDYDRLAIARPGMLKGDRGEFRMLEKFGEFFTDRLPGNYRTIHAGDVAAALILEANTNFQGTRILTSKAMQGAHLKEIDQQVAQG